MAERPILFSGPMVRAILEGRKTQTRRTLYSHKTMKPCDKIPRNAAFDRRYAPPVSPSIADFFYLSAASKIKPGDRLWVRESWRTGAAFDPVKPSLLPQAAHIAYEQNDERVRLTGKLRPSMFMPRWASRITLLVEDVRVQRLQDISEEDAKAEGCFSFIGRGPNHAHHTHVDDFQRLWHRINGKRPGCAWADNPWVAAYTFKPILKNIDAVGASHD